MLLTVALVIVSLAVVAQPTANPVVEPPGMTAETAAAVDTALQMLPSDGSTRGMFGRRDRCLLVLSQIGGVPYQQLAALTAGDIDVTDGTARVSGAGETWMVTASADPSGCGACAVTRWLRVLNLAVTQPSTRAIAAVLKDAKPVTRQSPHLCRSTRPLDERTLAAPLLPPIDQWGYEPFPVQPLTPHSLSRRVRDLLAGDAGAHRDLPVQADQETEPKAVGVPVTQRAVYTPQATGSGPGRDDASI